jgi:hypothetical protein
MLLSAWLTVGHRPDQFPWLEWHSGSANAPGKHQIIHLKTETSQGKQRSRVGLPRIPENDR